MVQFGTGTRCKKLKVRNFWGLIPMFVEVIGVKLVGRPFCSPPPQSRIGLRLRWSANARNKDGKLHTHTVPVKLCCPQNNKRKPHIGAYFAMASVKYARDLAELFSDEHVFFLFQDGKC